MKPWGFFGPTKPLNSTPRAGRADPAAPDPEHPPNPLTRVRGLYAARSHRATVRSQPRIPLHMRLFCLIPALFLSSAWGQPVPLEGENSAGFIARWNAWVASVEPDQAAFVEVVRLVDAIDAALDEVDPSRGVRWQMEVSLPGSPEWAVVERAADRIRPLTDELRAVLERPYLAMRLGGPVAEGEPGPQDRWANWTESQCLLFPADTSGESTLRRALGLLDREVIVARRRGDVAIQVAYPVAAFELARLTGEWPTFIGALTASMIGRVALNAALDRVELQQHGLSEASLEDLQIALSKWSESGGSYRRHVMVERMATEEWLAEWFQVDEPIRLSAIGRAWIEELWQLYEGFGSGIAAAGTTFSTIPKPDPDGEFAPADEQARVYRTIRGAMDRDAETAWHSVRSLEAPRLHTMIQANDPDGRLTPALLTFWVRTILLESEVRDHTKARAACVVLAVYRHHAATGQWPAALGDIKPGHMRIEPLDPYSGKPFGYAVIDGQPLVWSLGVDQDDDAGRRGGWDGYAPPWMPRDDYDALPEEARAQMDGDWLIFPEAPLSPASSDVQP